MSCLGWDEVPPDPHAKRGMGSRQWTRSAERATFGRVAGDVLRVPRLPRETQHKQGDVDFSMYFTMDGGARRKRPTAEYVKTNAG